MSCERDMFDHENEKEKTKQFQQIDKSAQCVDSYAINLRLYE